MIKSILWFYVYVTLYLQTCRNHFTYLVGLEQVPFHVGGCQKKLPSCLGFGEVHKSVTLVHPSSAKHQQSYNQYHTPKKENKAKHTNWIDRLTWNQLANKQNQKLKNRTLRLSLCLSDSLSCSDYPETPPAYLGCVNNNLRLQKMITSTTHFKN